MSNHLVEDNISVIGLSFNCWTEAYWKCFGHARFLCKL